MLTGRTGSALASQIAALRERLGNIALVILSDLPHDEEALAALSAAVRGYCNSHAAWAILTQVAEVVAQGRLRIGGRPEAAIIKRY